MITRLIENTAAVKRQADRLLLALGSLTDEGGELDQALAGKVDSSDSRLSDARTPKAHASTHGSGGSDPVTPAAIGAAAASHTHNYAGSASAGGAAASAAKLSTARTIDGMPFDGSANIVHYGACATAAATAAKVVTLAGFTLVTGARISVKFTYANTAASPTLNVNGTGAKPIAKYGTTAVDANAWLAGAVAELVYDGARWIISSSGGSNPITPASIGAAAASHTHNYAGSASAGGAATSAAKLSTARTIQTNLASTAAASFNGSANATPGVTGVLPVANGGTGISTLTNTAYTTSRLRGITLNASLPSSVPNGCIALVYA